MKFHWFHLMPYPALPDGFRQSYRSVWVDAPVRELFDPQVGHAAYNDYLDELEYADQLGFDGICVNEHHANAYGLMPSPNLMAAALARRTSKAALVVLGNSVALYNPPIRVAEEMAMLDVLSGGRLVAGFPVGTPMDATWAMGQNPVTLREKYREAVGLILRSWTADKPFPFNGKHSQLRYVNPWPRPMQQPHPPVWIPGGGSPETWDWCASNDFLYAYLSYFGYRAAKTAMNAYWEAVERAGRDPNPYRAGFLQFVGLAEDDAHAEELYSEAAIYFYERCLHVYPGFGSPPGYTPTSNIRRGVESQVKLATERPPPPNWKSILENGFIIAGSPGRVTEQLNELVDTLKVGHLMLLLHFGNLGKETVLYNSRRFAEEVAPALRPRFSEWEDRWWPRPGQPARSQMAAAQ
jgi:alkanesulfonate monooxygenase SsuD/methylene tetrahydromethanopterin reductase-like flavin-dependent oxidoreductase (luciferase family)